jgi:hypothetical protein
MGYCPRLVACRRKNTSRDGSAGAARSFSRTLDGANLKCSKSNGLPPAVHGPARCLPGPANVRVGSILLKKSPWKICRIRIRNN